MSPTHALPVLSRISFYRLTEVEFISAIVSAILRHVQQTPPGVLTEKHEALFAWGGLLTNVPNGGFTQFFYNHRGDHGVLPLADLLDSLEIPKAGPLLRGATDLYRLYRERFDTSNPWEGLFGTIKEFEKLDKAFMNVMLRGIRAIEKWVRENVSSLFMGDAGEVIDPGFTGTVEIPQGNGLVGEYLEVKKGKPHGAYREFFDDGTVRRVVFYKSGEVSGDFWPNGQIKKKESKRGILRVIEWFYPSGKLQKRFVKDKSGYAAEPVRRFHENGQLAEEITLVQGKKCGQWLKFFEDGSPQLQAEYVDDQTLVVHNAWDVDRRQAVKDGTGVFRDEGRSIHVEYGVYFDSGWPRESELKDGRPHGKVTVYRDGVVWSVAMYKDGVCDGDQTCYWNNGRVRSVTTYVHGQAGASRSFPKFDEPVPAVLLEVEANEALYAAWRHIAVDEYPSVLNLKEVQEQLEIPPFLREIHERNLGKTTRSEYENCDTFDDGIAYFLSVSETGEVTRATANGSGVCSGGQWDTYVPLLEKLRFAPGRIRGRAVECRVLAHVRHTFVEGRAVNQ